MTKQTQSLWQRFICFLLAAITVLGMFPMSAWAGGDTAKNTYKDTLVSSGGNYLGKYNSPNLKKDGAGINLRGIPITLGDNTQTWGFCNDHGASLASGQTYKQTSWDCPEALKPFLNWFYFHTLKQNDFNAWETNFATGYLNTIVWLYNDKQYNSYNDPAQLAMLAQERDTALAAIGQSGGGSLSFYNNIIQEYKSGMLGEYEYFLLDPSNSSQQSVITARQKPNNYPVYLKLSKIDSGTGAQLSGAVFGVYLTAADAQNGTNRRGQIDTVNAPWSYSPKIRIENPTATLYVRELKAPAGYTRKDTVTPVNVDTAQHGTEATAAAVGTGSFTNDPLPVPTGVIAKVDALTGAGIAGAHLTLKSLSNGAEKTLITGTNGELKLQWDNPSGADYIPTGEYTVTETKAPNGYVLDAAQVQNIRLWVDSSGNPQHSGPILFYNYPQGTITLKKVDENGKGLKGAKFLVLKDGLKVDEVATDSNGTFVLDELSDGYYTFIETQPPAGHLLPFVASKGIRVDSKTAPTGGYTLNMTNYEYPEIVIEKRASDTNLPLAGAMYEVKLDATTIGTFATNDAGMIVIDYATYGQYLKAGKPSWTITVTEVQPPDGYMPPIPADLVQTAQLKQGQTLSSFVFFNQPLPNVEVTKKDAQDGKLLAGATFLLTSVSTASGATYNQELVSDATGRVTFQRVPIGVYHLSEKTPPAGYLPDNTVHTITVTQGCDQTFCFEYLNEKKPALVIRKIDSVTGEPLKNVKFKVEYTIQSANAGDSAFALWGDHYYYTDDKGEITLTDLKDAWYKLTEVEPPTGYTIREGEEQLVVYMKSGTSKTVTFENVPLGEYQLLKVDADTGKPLANAQFRIAKMNGAIIGTYTTDSKGIIHLSKLDNGWYTATETKAPKGYLLDETPHNFEVVDTDSKVITVTNRKKSQILIRKIDANTGEGIYGVTFILYDKNKNPIGQFISDQQGYVFIDEGLADGKYHLRELEPAEGYLRDNELKTIWVKAGTTTEVEWENTAIRAQIQILKLSADDNPINGLPAGTRLEGAVFEIYNKANQLVDTIVTDKNGRAVSKLLPLSRYTIREVKAPPYYAINDAVLNAYLEHEGQILVFEVRDKSVSTGVSIKKTGPFEVVSNQPVRYTFTGIANTSSVPLLSFYWRDTLPAEVQLRQVLTGTYNQNLSYKIVYKTNVYGEYRTLADNLNTQQNYVLDASPTALGLAQNERVTEIMLVFGTVRAGFAQVENPQILGQTLYGLRAGSFVNVADVGGVYNNQWIMGVSRWTTVIYSKIMPSLPKTGY